MAPPSLHWPGLGLTLDEQGDYLLLSKIIEALEPENPMFTCLDIIRLLKSKPTWLDMNSNVMRKSV